MIARKLLGADVANDAVLDPMLVGLPGIHLAEQSFKLIGREHLADDVEDLVGPKIVANLRKPFEQFLQHAALAGVLGHEVEDEAVLLLAVAVDAADALLKPDGIPRNVEVDHQPAELKLMPSPAASVATSIWQLSLNSRSA